MKSVDIKVFTSDHKSFERYRFSPVTKGTEYTVMGAKLVIAQMVELLKKQFPGNEFKVVQLNDRSFNIMPVPLANA